jgi:cytochrome c oxidase subunit 1/cytochrome c oxidase subunit I+III
VIPRVASRHPLWEGRLPGAERSSLDQGLLLDVGKETIGTSALDAQPDMILEMPEDSLAPVILTLGIAGVFTGLILKVWAITGLCLLIVAIGLLWWLWPRRGLREREPSHD